jgi:hypothetical protein
LDVGVSGVIIDDHNDHLVTSAVIPAKPVHQRKRDIITRSYSTTNIQNFKNHLGSFAWNDVLSESDVDLAYGKFFDTTHSGMGCPKK